MTDFSNYSLPAQLASRQQKQPCILPFTWVGRYSKAPIISRVTSVGRLRYFYARASLWICRPLRTNSFIYWLQLPLKKIADLSRLIIWPEPRLYMLRIPLVYWPLHGSLLKKQCSHPQRENARPKESVFQLEHPWRDALSQLTSRDKINLLSKEGRDKGIWVTSSNSSCRSEHLSQLAIHLDRKRCWGHTQHN
jgi:hypothetical protein